MILHSIIKMYFCKSPYFNSSKPVTDINLLYPPFKNLLSQSIQEFQNSYPGVMVGIGETYRGLPLQKYYKSVDPQKLLPNSSFGNCSRYNG